MPVIAVVSAKGGVGKTTVTANLSLGFVQRGFSVLVLDLDPQNAIQWHMGGLPHDVVSGLSVIAGDRAPKLWEVAFSSASGVDFVPYGSAGEQQRIDFEQVLEQQEEWLLKLLKRAKLPKNTIVLLDTPPGPSAYLSQAIHAADFLLAVVLADAASYSTIPEMESLIAVHTNEAGLLVDSAYLVNQVSSSQLSQDVVSLYREQLGARVVPILIPESAQIEEALAYERSVLDYEPESLAATALQEVADWLLLQLQLQAK
ncbi:cellulose biosynthesis protein BcsQ [Undibacterium sp. Xuan67W]|uniref:cellulose biosynthesis protein BcsQ n=1 Tax=Undibacterium sp. Xuan67W TaxID=3413057 RepID=UPI003BF03EA5